MAKKKNMTIPELAFALTQHADDLQMFANGVSMDALSDFEQTEDSIMELLYKLYEKFEETGLKPDLKTSRYLDNLQTKIEEIRNNVFDDEEDEVIERSKDVEKNEVKFSKAFLFALAGIESVALTSAVYDKISKYGIFNEGTVSQIFKKLSAGDTGRIYESMISSIRGGLPLKTARENLKKELNRTNRFAKSEIDSILNGAANDAVLAFASENNLFVMYSTVLDSKVCKECSMFEGRIYRYDDPGIPSIPQHIFCRCRYIPVPDGKTDYKGLILPFGNYYAKLSNAEQKKRIGNAKYDLYANGDYALKDYEEPLPEQRLSLAEMKERDKKLFQS